MSRFFKKKYVDDYIEENTVCSLELCGMFSNPQYGRALTWAKESVAMGK